MDEGLPVPSYLYHKCDGYELGYEIDGFFGTRKNSEFLNDIIARFLISFSALKPQRLPHKPLRYNVGAHYYEKIYRLKELQNLKSLKKKVKAPTRADSFDDYVFWSIKLYTEDLIRAQGLVSYHQIEYFAYSNFEHKERSTLRAKCRSIFNYYESRNWELRSRRARNKTNEEIFMTRVERAKSNAQARADKAKKAVYNTMTGIFADEYKKKSGAWHIQKIAEACSVHREVVSKYIKEFEAKNS